MAKRLFLIGLLALTVACKSKGTRDKESEMSASPQASADFIGRDAVEKALLTLGIEGRVLRVDLNETKWKDGPVQVQKSHLFRELLVLESGGAKPKVLALRREGLRIRWASDLQEPTAYRPSENLDAILLTSEHYVHALEKSTGLQAMMFVGGSLDGVRRPALHLPFVATGRAVAQSDTLYVPSLGSSINNKTIETFSLVTGDRGWGYRSSSEIFTSPAVGGDVGDPKLYFVTRTGHVTCMDATNYGFSPSNPRWEGLLEAGVDFDFFLTDDRKGTPGGLFVVDREGVVYCLDRTTGNRRWVNATQRQAVGAPQVFGDVVVVKMASGLIGFDSDNVLYQLTVEQGPDAGKSFIIRNGGVRSLGSNEKDHMVLTDAKVGDRHLLLEISGEILTAACQGANRMEVDGSAPVQRSTLREGSLVAIGDTVLAVRDIGARALWSDLKYDRVVARVGNRLVAAKGNHLILLDAHTGAALGPRVSFAAARLIPTNHWDGNLFVVAGDAVVYALFAR
ncbi:MAG: outer membrane protein assembly factor BamB family protein [Planctomycetota bacterium]